jgi:hypothetical protein
MALRFRVSDNLKAPPPVDLAARRARLTHELDADRGKALIGLRRPSR